MKYVASKNQKVYMADLKCVYKATTLNAAENALDELEAKWGDKYRVVIKPWRAKWPTLTWVDWFNHHRILRPIGDMPPSEYENLYYQQAESTQAV